MLLIKAICAENTRLLPRAVCGPRGCPGSELWAGSPIASSASVMAGHGDAGIWGCRDTGRWLLWRRGVLSIALKVCMQRGMSVAVSVFPRRSAVQGRHKLEDEDSTKVLV